MQDGRQTEFPKMYGQNKQHRNPQTISITATQNYFFNQRDAAIPAAPTTARMGVAHSGESLHPLCARAIPVEASKINTIKQIRFFTTFPFRDTSWAIPNRPSLNSRASPDAGGACGANYWSNAASRIWPTKDRATLELPRRSAL